MELEKIVDTVKPALVGNLEKKPYQEPKLIEHGQWTEKTGPAIGGSGG